jgi:hypothetical protein
MHTPMAKIVTVFAETAHTLGVFDKKLTGNPELAVALRVKGAVPKRTLAIGANVMLCIVAILVAS